MLLLSVFFNALQNPMLQIVLVWFDGNFFYMNLLLLGVSLSMYYFPLFLQFRSRFKFCAQ
jgi:hypothetical protein